MRLEHVDQEQFKQAIKAIVSRHLDLSKYKLFIFGSRVRGEGNERSDIDIGIEGPEPLPIKAKFDIIDEIEALPYLYKMDVVDFAKVSDEFKQDALKSIEIIE